MSRWVPTFADAVRPAAESLPADAVIVTATPELLGPTGTRPGDPLVLSVAPTEGVRRRYLRDVTEQTVADALGADLGGLRHVRVVTDLSALGAAREALDGDPSRVFALQDAVFLTLKATESALRTHGGTVLALFTDAYRDGVLHPYAGLFTGLLKSAALELDQNVVTSVFTDQTALEPALEELVAESRATRFLPVAVYTDGVRHTMVTEETPAEPGPTVPLDASAVVVAVGGARGITAEVVKAVAARYRPVIYTFGSKPLDELTAELDQYGAAGLPPRAAFVRAELARTPGRSVKEINGRYEQLDAGARMLANLAEMRAWSGPDRVHHVTADVLDEPALRAAFDRIAAEHGRIDLLIHAAGINRASAIASKTLPQFRAVRAVKSQGYLNLRRALGELRPRFWCNFSSLIGLTGQRGETDYAASNDFLATAASLNRAVHGRDEFTIGWTLWREVGMASSSVHQSFFSAGPMANVLTFMPSAEGVYHFLSELEGGNRVAAIHHLGATERAAVADIVPGYFQPRRPAGRPSVLAPPVPVTATVPDRGTFYLDSVTRHGVDKLVAERWFTAERDGYLEHHTVRGVATLPGCFVAELAAEAANALLPELTVVGFRNLTFDHFLKLGGATERSPRRILATLRAREAGQAVVDVRVVGDVLSPHGVLLHRDKPHFTATVVLAERYPVAPRPEPWPDAPEQDILDPYHAPAASVSLTGPFVTTTRTRLHPLGKRARYTAPVGPDTEFQRFLVPALLLDGLIRLAVLELVQGRYVPVAAPSGIRRIDLYAPDNDVDLAAGEAPIELSATPRGLLVESPTAGSRFLATRPDGRALLQVQDVQGFVTGYVDTVTGLPVDTAQVAATGAHNGSSWPRTVPGAIAL
ncbi:SDR family NAD(P)-dependent oxidoreductase [Micromonospora sp. STR1s_6]|uniref:SDR family NAD(P)-dependent oxidoreductase n=1 Tax=Micromonospora tarensis TaxID=2806100 RepID=A0ABS1YF26_9ACTN|nr:SDR family NAD(P)-dependent oxidoreductase [Micromonospora tarensis]